MLGQEQTGEGREEERAPTIFICLVIYLLVCLFVCLFLKRWKRKRRWGRWLEQKGEKSQEQPYKTSFNSE